ADRMGGRKLRSLQFADKANEALRAGALNCLGFPCASSSLGCCNLRLQIVPFILSFGRGTDDDQSHRERGAALQWQRKLHEPLVAFIQMESRGKRPVARGVFVAT